MKRILFILLMIPTICFAQKGFESSIKISYEVPLDQNQSFGADYIARYRISETFKIGLGTGAYWCSHLYEENYKYEDYKESAMYIPIYINGKINFTGSDISPYFVLDLGYSLFISFSDYANENKLGLFARPGFGIDFPIGEGKLFTEIGYKYQKREWDYFETPDYSQITISVGYSF